MYFGILRLYIITVYINTVWFCILDHNKDTLLYYLYTFDIIVRRKYDETRYFKTYTNGKTWKESGITKR